MTRITSEAAQHRLAALVADLKPGEEIQIFRDDRPVARLVGEPTERRASRRAGSAIGLLVVATDDEDHLEDFREFMP